MSILLSVIMVFSLFTIVPLTASAATATVTLTAADFGDVDIYAGETASANGVIFRVNGGYSNFYVEDFPNWNFSVRKANM